MHKVLALLLAAPIIGFAAESPGPLTVAQQLFDAMASHNANAARALFISDAMLYGIGPNGTPGGLPFEKWLDQFGKSNGSWLERIWNPKVLQHGTAAAVWADYDFHLDGKFSHCGVDSFSLLKTNAGWKIASITDTREKTGCAPSPLGPPPQK
ncbi:MAG: hypothetical protein JWP08_3361 [Bryobacterales bacterium]|jgi:SnoaL-like protein|nr:hypothetical protein [Bryobacterales bacterium]